ncbi:MAG: O-antigen ligase family protein [Patescibacteria group bacterium]
MNKIFFKIYQFGLVILVLLFPLANSDLYYFVNPKLYPARAFLVVLILFSGLALMANLLRKKSAGFIINEIKSDQFLKIVLALFVVRAVSINMSRNYQASFLLLAFFASMIALYLMLKYVFSRDGKFLFNLYLVHLLAVALIGFYGIAQALLLLIDIKLPGVLLGGTFLRVPATFYDANHLPAYLLTGLPFILVFGWMQRNKILGRLLLGLTGLLGVVVLLSFSRSGFAGFFLSFVIIFLSIVRFGYWQKAAQLFSIVVIIAFVIFLSGRTQFSLVNRLFGSFTSAEKSTVAHVALLYGEFKIFLDHPVLGVGYGSFSEYFRSSEIGREHAVVDPATQVRIPPHSLWLEALSETGIVGFSLYLSLLLLIFESLVKALRKVSGKKDRLYLTGLLAGFLGLNLASIFYSFNLEFFWFYLIYCYLYSRKVYQTKEALPTPAALEESEKLPWREIGAMLFTALFSGIFIFWGLGWGHLLSEEEGLNAYLSKWMLRRYEMGWPDFWITQLQASGWFQKTPFAYWLGTVMMFLYYITTFSAKFFPAFFGWLATLLVYLLGRRFFGRGVAILAGMILVALPLFLLNVRTGAVYPILLFYLLTLVLAASRLRTQPTLWLAAGIIQLLFFFTDQQLAWWPFTILSLYGIFLLFRAGKAIRKRAYFPLLCFLSYLVLAIVPFSFWYQSMAAKFGEAFIQGFPLTPVLIYSPLLLLVLLSLSSLILAYWLTRRLHLFNSVRSRLVLVVFLAILAGTGNLQTRQISPDYRQLKLAAARYNDNGDGNMPLLVDHTPSWVLTYYSEIPIWWRTGRTDMEKSFLDGKLNSFYAILPGADFRVIRRQLVGRQIGIKIVAAAEDWVLVKKW